MTSAAAYDDLLHEIYESALRPERWSATMAAIARVFDASRAVIFTFLHGPEQGGFAYTHNLSQAELDEWAEASRSQEDPFVRAALERKLLVNGATYEGTQLVPREELVTTRLYRDLWSRWDIEHICATVVFDGRDGVRLPTAMSLYRTPRQRTFDAGEVERVGRLCMHLSRALGAMLQARTRARETAASHAALDHLGSAVVMLDAAGTVTWRNRAARRLLAGGGAVREAEHASTRAVRLKTVRQAKDVQAAFDEAIAAACAPGDAGVPAPRTFALDDRDGRTACIVRVVSFEHGALVVLHDLRGGVRLVPGVLRSLFGMTPAEVRAARQIAEGGSVDAMAERLGVSVNTLKTQLKAVYAKTGTGRQPELLRLLLALGDD